MSDGKFILLILVFFIRYIKIRSINTKPAFIDLNTATAQ